MRVIPNTLQIRRARERVRDLWIRAVRSRGESMASTAVMRGTAGGGGKGKAVALPDDKKKSAVVVSKSEVKGNTSGSSSKTVTKTVTKTTTVRARVVKKVYTLPGQKHDPPEEREPLRIFYESLSKQIPTSEMAEFWMMEHGLLSPERAKKAYERKQKRQQQLRMGTPIKSIKQERPESSEKPLPSKTVDVKAKKRVNYSDDDDYDIIVKHKKLKG